MENQIFIPHELRTIEIDVEKKIFRVNGDDFGDGCTACEFSIEPGTFQVKLHVDTVIHFATYNSRGAKQQEEVYETNDPWNVQESPVIKGKD